jgi:FKBP-type peptidyl-prolyl cis-trans isomerase
MRFICILLLLIVMVGCNNQAHNPGISEKALKEKLIQRNRLNFEMEMRRIKDYTEMHYPAMKATATGLHYDIFKPDQPSDVRIKKGDWVYAMLHIERLNGEKIYQSGSGSPEYIHVAFDETPSGIHEGLQMMAVGDSAIFILPSHLGFGLTGDQKTIGSNEILLIKLIVLEVDD